LSGVNVETNNKRSNLETTIAGKTAVKPQRKSNVAVTVTKTYIAPLRIVEIDANERKKAESDDLSTQEQQQSPTKVGRPSATIPSHPPLKPSEGLDWGKFKFRSTRNRELCCHSRNG
jgi:hypothetical protein